MIPSFKVFYDLWNAFVEMIPIASLNNIFGDVPFDVEKTVADVADY